MLPTVLTANQTHYFTHLRCPATPHKVLSPPFTLFHLNINEGVE